MKEPNVNVHSIKFVLTYSDYRTPAGLEDVSKYPALFAELLARGWSERDIQKLAGLNLIRVFKTVEQVNNVNNCMPHRTVCDFHEQSGDVCPSK